MADTTKNTVKKTRKPKPAKETRRIRYAVVGLGHIAQTKILPAFENAGINSEVTALVSDDEAKLCELGEKHGVTKLYSYEQYDECLKSGAIDVVYIALPNHLHCEYTVRAAEAGIHVLCEKPMAVTAAECEKMIHACESSDVKLMIAYRLHFDKANLKAVQVAHSGRLGELRIFDSLFTIDVQPGNVRLKRELGGGDLYDIGIYCINAARYIFRDEPIEVFAVQANGGDRRFSEVNEMTSAILRFPQERLAVFTSSFASGGISSYRVVGTKGNLRVEPAYDYFGKLTHHLTIDGKTKKTAFPETDQFAPELIYFSNCILQNREPEPSGKEGLADVRILEALYESMRREAFVQVPYEPHEESPSPEQAMELEPIEEPALVHAAAPTDD